jgi:toxin-antitoxin system, antitoxin component, xre family
MDFKKDFKDLLKNLRIEKGLTQKALANKIGIPVSMISKYEQGTNKPSISYLAKICAFFEIGPSFFLADFDEKKEETFDNNKTILENELLLSAEIDYQTEKDKSLLKDQLPVELQKGVFEIATKYMTNIENGNVTFVIDGVSILDIKTLKKILRIIEKKASEDFENLVKIFKQGVNSQITVKDIEEKEILYYGEVLKKNED